MELMRSRESQQNDNRHVWEAQERRGVFIESFSQGDAAESL